MKNFHIKPLGLLDMLTFKNMVPKRRKIIDAAPAAPLPKTYAVNETAKALHPARQSLAVEAVVERGPDTKSYVLAPDQSAGTAKLAYFRAGQYISLKLKIGGSVLTRPYSISSAPLDALSHNRYMLTVKRAQDGFASGYLLDNLKVGDKIEASGPEGTFYYEALRDAAAVVGIAGGSGITPFYAMALAIADGTEDFNLTVLYGSRTRENILLKEEFDKIAGLTDKVRVVHVLSDERADGYEHGFITAELIQKYAPDNQAFSVFMCGPQQMYAFVDKEIETLGLPVKYVRHELFGPVKDPTVFPDYPAEAMAGHYKIKVKLRDEEREIPANGNEPVLAALERAGINAPSKCRSGECGWCHSRLISGRTYTPASMDGRRLADHTFGYIHPCCAFPLSDLELDVPIEE